jgi:hypothetical protein
MKLSSEVTMSNAVTSDKTCDRDASVAALSREASLLKVADEVEAKTRRMIEEAT